MSPANIHQQRKQRAFHPPPLFWDSLPRLWLTKSSLKEFDRRYRPFSSRASEASALFFPQSFAPDFLRTCSNACVQEIRRLSRYGGPDLSDISGYPIPPDLSEDSIEPLSNTAPPSAVIKTMSNMTTVYDRKFEQHLTEHGIYMPFHEYPDGTWVSESENFEILEKDALKAKHREFVILAYKTVDKQLDIKDILPLLDGQPDPDFHTGAEDVFDNLDPLTDGTLASATPDSYDGTRLSQLNQAVRGKLNHQVIPTTDSARPIVPNFFFEFAKPTDGSGSVLIRQVCYDGALGARAIHSLRQFIKGNNNNNDTTASMPALYDNNAYTMTSTYQTGLLSLYTMHPTRSRSNNNSVHTDYDTVYVTTILGQWALLSSPQSFKEGITAYRNARDLAKSYRDKFVAAVNEKYMSDHKQNFATDDIE
ncbi:hypothetical protein BJY04DRAFT_211912 [Aspergillus karnatakaensis]|uniref:uncharacterized protein n=1 Tax=Aspergillus karnatakaensis TaxID=1810916 RepID=UPI003CCD7DF7